MNEKRNKNELYKKKNNVKELSFNRNLYFNQG